MRKEIKKEIQEIKEEIDNFEIDESDYEDSYREMIRDAAEPIFVGMIEFDPVEILSKLDPVAYNYGLADYIDSLDVEDDERFQELQEKLEELELEDYEAD